MIKTGVIRFFEIEEGDILNDIREIIGRNVGPGWYWFDMPLGTGQPAYFSGPFASEQEAQENAKTYIKDRYTVLSAEIYHKKDINIH